jgi:uncharacterized coiled-coil protein SlyX
MDRDRLDDQLETLQSELAFQGDALERLSDAFAAQQRTLLELERRVRLLASRLEELRARLPAEGPEPPPPHY